MIGIRLRFTSIVNHLEDKRVESVRSVNIYLQLCAKANEVRFFYDRVNDIAFAGFPGFQNRCQHENCEVKRLASDVDNERGCGKILWSKGIILPDLTERKWQKTISQKRMDKLLLVFEADKQFEYTDQILEFY